ncbi:DMT family transporter [Bernardetia sp. Wsw4-3y2]|uniref:DMT family transporter n=1 Tax=Bernardetia sp. Wsw4-3y2 TaxID=3127471 RepID=UPI0030D618A9
MKLLLLYLLAFTGGVFLAIQAGFNSQLGSLLKQPVLAVIATSISSAFFGSLFIFSMTKDRITFNLIYQIPWYLWFIGGLFSFVGISLYFYTIPRLGVSKMIVAGLCGQLLFSLLAGHFGWLNLPLEPITTKRIIGILVIITGIVLINDK